MRRTLTVVLLTFVVSLPLCAQRRGASSHSSGSAPARSTTNNFGSRGSTAFRSSTGFRGGVVLNRGTVFGGTHGFGIGVGSRPFHHNRFSVYPYRYRSSYVYPYIYYPVYPLSFYDTYDYTSVPTERAYTYDYASGADNYPPDYGLNEQMKQMGVGIYGRPRQAAPEQAAPAVQQPERAMPATVLIYKDGRREEVKNYAIVGQTVWTFTERVANKVPLSELNVDATRKANEERGIDFVVPQQQ